jgi:oxygen-independent coproporphyrinogen-3 oxidase
MGNETTVHFVRPPSAGLSVLPPLALYIHIPWCVRKCPYCDFNSHALQGELQEEAYIQALMGDLEQSLPLIWGRRVHCVFFGGGTPSLFSAQALEQILSGVRARLPLDCFAEITLEANPGTFEARKFARFRECGINRLSIGIQSFNPGHLSALGRIHNDEEAKRAIEMAQQHFDNINLDLMYALPGQSVDEARQDIVTASAFAPQHISAYHLTIEPNTYFYRYPPELPDDDAATRMQDVIEDTLDRHGFTHYETSAYARPGRQCRHNRNYWEFGDYLGIGAGAHSKLSFPDRIIRQSRVKLPQTYMQAVETCRHIEQEVTLGRVELAVEFMMNALRLNAGFPVRLFEERTGLPIACIHPALEEAEGRGLIERDHLRIGPTPLGQRFLNEVLLIFMPQKL